MTVRTAWDELIAERDALQTEKAQLQKRAEKWQEVAEERGDQLRAAEAAIVKLKRALKAVKGKVDQ